MTEWTVKEIAYELNQRITDVLSFVGISYTNNGRTDTWIKNPTRNDHNPSLQIQLRGADIGKWHDWGTDDKGDALEFLSYILGISKKEAIADAKRIIGLDDTASDHKPPVIPVVEQVDEYTLMKEFEKAKKDFWIEAQEDVLHSPVYSYLKGRGIDLRQLPRIPKSIRFHPAMYHAETQKKLPAMVWLFWNKDGITTGMHITYLQQDADGSWKKFKDGKAKIMKGQIKFAFIPIARGASGMSLSEKNHGNSVMIAEGIETALSLALAHPDERILAAGSVSNIQNVRLPDDIRNVCLCMDNDGIDAATIKPYNEAFKAFEEQGRKVFKLVPEHNLKDFNDWLQFAPEQEENVDEIPF